MEYLHIAVLALIQGITEFLPISSSGHLVLVPVFTGWQDQGMVIDVAAHVGTAGAVILYFWRDLWAMAVGLARMLKGRRDPGAPLAGYIVVGTIPAVIAGFLLNYYIGDGLRLLEIIAWTIPGYGLLLLISDKVGLTVRRVEHLGVSDAILIGCAQALALVPGTSRSGITITAARLLGMERTDAARFSMLLSIPANLGAGTLKGMDLYASGDAALTNAALLAAAASLVVGLFAIWILMSWVRRSTFTVFAVYRFLLGGFLLAMVYGWLPEWPF